MPPSRVRTPFARPGRWPGNGLIFKLNAELAPANQALILDPHPTASPQLAATSPLWCHVPRLRRSDRLPAESAHVVEPPRMPVQPTIANYTADTLFPRVKAAVLAQLATGTIVTPVDVFLRMGLLQPAQLAAWRSGSVPFLERVILGSLSKHTRILCILAMYCHDLKLAPSHTGYVRQGKGPRQPLRFSKSSVPALEAAFARHFIWPGKIPFHLPRGSADSP